jgi:hypothetical protein
MSTANIPAPADEDQVTLVGTLPKDDNFSSFSSAARARKAVADAILAEKVFLDGACEWLGEG